MDAELQNQKLLAETQKLKLEIEGLRRPFSRPSMWLSSALAVAGISAAVLQMVESGFRRTINELEISKISELKKVAQMELDEIKSERMEEELILSRVKAERNEAENERANYFSQTEILKQTLGDIEKRAEEVEQIVTGQDGIGDELEAIRRANAINAEIIENIQQVRKGPLVVYYEKPLDGNAVNTVLSSDQLSFEFRYQPIEGAVYEGQAVGTNAIHCGTGTNIDEVRELAIALLDAGIKIQEFGPPLSTWKTRNDDVIYIMTVNDEDFYNSERVLTPEDIISKDCNY